MDNNIFYNYCETLKNTKNTHMKTKAKNSYKSTDVKILSCENRIKKMNYLHNLVDLKYLIHGLFHDIYN